LQDSGNVFLMERRVTR